MTQRVLVIGHADADGHLITEQTRRNLALNPMYEVSTIIDPSRTRDHKVWHKLDQFGDIDSSHVVFFVDMMFSPVSYSAESRALVEFVQAHSEKRFFLLDHHPIPFKRLGVAANLRAVYRPDVFDCTFGPRSGMMVVAALCEKQGARVLEVKTPEHELLALGVRRAAALGGPLPGEKLLALMRSNRWLDLARLGKDPKEFHRLPRGLRPANDPKSATLLELNETAEALVDDIDDSRSQPRKPTMSYDVDALPKFDIGKQRFQRHDERELLANVPASPKDLEALVTLLEVAALSLTPAPEVAFTYEELLKETRDLCGDEMKVEERDVRIVLEKASFLRKTGREYRLK
jgi:hypothetical protein